MCHDGHVGCMHRLLRAEAQNLNVDISAGNIPSELGHLGSILWISPLGISSSHMAGLVTGSTRELSENIEIPGNPPPTKW
jgi:hypothetical protein